MKGFVEKVYSLTPKHGADEERVSVLMIKVYQHLSTVAQFDKREVEFDFKLEDTSNERGIPEELRQPLKTLTTLLLDILNEDPAELAQVTFADQTQKVLHDVKFGGGLNAEGEDNAKN